MALEALDLTKSFGATKALAGASFSVRAGGAHALLGENGAGKSTTIKLLSGLIQPDSGTIKVHGQQVEFRNTRDAHRHGLQTAFQELTLAPDLTVLQNMILAYEPVRLAGQIDRKKARQIVEAHFEKLALTDIDLRADLRDLSLNQRQRVEIARALFRNPKILFLDEATSTLSGREIEWLSRIIADLKAGGVTVVMITHKMPEVRDYCEHVTVLRNGRDVGSFETSSVSDEELVELIIGRSLDATFPPKPVAKPSLKPLLSVKGMATERRLSDCSFDLNPGEIVGIAGLQGMGQAELFMGLYGATPITRGEIRIDGELTYYASPRQAINQGIALVPEERKTEGLFLELSGQDNVAASSLDRMTRFGFIDSRREIHDVATAMDTVQVDKRALYTRAGAFSGGNQQKMVLAKALLMQPRILLLFDPCRGVDVGTKHEIYLLIKAFAEGGGAALLYSSETPELVNLCNLVVVLYGGRVAEILDDSGGKMTEKTIMRAALGHGSRSTAQRAIVGAA
ncbi:sugar ABC transporter ATP-binding protein [Mesorhizobium sp. B3-1-6]|uniref:sugar ABC transporter ATP-binding protein n=1 Tax=Mesorhizobium sp. B3-1-6 TaxID=2589895 RepID=UPI00248476B5|nr:sugar ABC transporter ATP-binding protein [Mesorhizobium sp. B3-1-6]